MCTSLPYKVNKSDFIQSDCVFATNSDSVRMLLYWLCFIFLLHILDLQILIHTHIPTLVGMTNSQGAVIMLGRMITRNAQADMFIQHQYLVQGHM